MTTINDITTNYAEQKNLIRNLEKETLKYSILLKDEKDPELINEYEEQILIYENALKYFKKQIPMDVIPNPDTPSICPNCKRSLHVNKTFSRYRYNTDVKLCPHCYQTINWILPAKSNTKLLILKEANQIRASIKTIWKEIFNK